MKRFLLSSIIMLGVCGIASAQSDSKMNRKTPAATTSAAAAPTPQKAAIMPASDAAVAALASTTDDKAAATGTAVKATDVTSAATTVNAAGEVVPVSDAQRKEAKMAAVKAANAAANTAPKGKQQN